MYVGVYVCVLWAGMYSSASIYLYNAEWPFNLMSHGTD